MRRGSVRDDRVAVRTPRSCLTRSVWAADLHNMKGAVVDAMAVAIDGAAVMLSCLSLAYKESANCRMEAQYGHQQNVDMIPLVCLLLAVALRPSCATAHRSMCR